MIRALPQAALGGIQSGLAKAAAAADHVAKSGIAVEDRVTLSSDSEPRGTAEALVDLRLASYQVAANAAVMRTYDELQGAWMELGSSKGSSTGPSKP